MKFEDLANELLLDLFELFDVIHLFRAFYDLNSRFNQLLFIYSRQCRLNFQSIPKYDFEYVCQHYLPLTMNRIVSLGLPDADETPNLPELFLSHGFTLDQFKNLQTLSLYSISSISILNQLIFQCRHLQHLTHLYIINCSVYCEQEEILCFMNHIWSISKLKYCHLNGKYLKAISFPVSTIVSQSIEYLIMKNMTLDLNNLSYLFQCTPNLRRFHTTVSCISHEEELKNIFSSIISLKLNFLGTIDTMKYLFSNIKNLSYLTLETWNIYLNGYEWQTILSDILPQIKLFRFKMNFNFKYITNQEEEVNTLLDSFRTQFWLEIRQQYVQCDWISSAIRNNATIYTLPYAFRKFSYDDTTYSKSTCPNQRNIYSYNRVKTIEYLNNRYRSSNNFIPFHLQFPNVHHFIVEFRFENNISSIYSSLNYLTTFDITVNEWFDYSQLQILLDRAPHLYSLKLNNLTNLHMILSQIRSTSIRRLEFIKKRGACNQYFDEIECTTLVNSSLGYQCEVLLIDVTNRNIILDLINKISNLRILIIKCEDDKFDESQLSSNFDELILWLDIHLPKTYSISRDMKYPYNIHIWIDRKQQEDIPQIHTTKHTKTSRVSRLYQTVKNRYFP